MPARVRELSPSQHVAIGLTLELERLQTEGRRLRDDLKAEREAREIIETHLAYHRRGDARSFQWGAAIGFAAGALVAMVVLGILGSL